MTTNNTVLFSKTVGGITASLFMDVLHKAYLACSTAMGQTYVPMYPIADLLVKCWNTDYPNLGRALQACQELCQQGYLPYGMALEVDADYREQAADNRRRADHRVIVHGVAVRVIEVRRKPTAPRGGTA